MNFIVASFIESILDLALPKHQGIFVAAFDSSPALNLEPNNI